MSTEKMLHSKKNDAIGCFWRNHTVTTFDLSKNLGCWVIFFQFREEISDEGRGPLIQFCLTQCIFFDNGKNREIEEIKQ